MNRIAAFLIVAFLFVGRWSPGRLTDSNDLFATVEVLYEPRFWIVVALIFTTFVIASARRKPLSQGVRIALAATVCFFLYTILSAVWTYDSPDAQVKMYEIGMILAVAVAYAVIQSNCEINESIIRYSLYICGVLMLLGILAVAGSSGEERLAVLGGGPNVFGKNMGFLLICCTTFYFTGKKNLAWGGLALMAAFALILSGSRGAIVASLVTMMFLLLFSKYGASKKIRALILSAILVVIVVQFTRVGEVAYHMFEGRIFQSLIIQRYTSSRDVLAQDALNAWQEHPVFGIGLGAFSEFNEHGVQYPHNLFLEVLSEGGVIGILLLLGVFITTLVTIIRSRSWQTSYGMFLIACTLFFTLASQFSGNLFDSRSIFIFLLMCCFSVGPGTALVGNARSARSPRSPEKRRSPESVRLPKTLKLPESKRSPESKRRKHKSGRVKRRIKD